MLSWEERPSELSFVTSNLPTGKCPPRRLTEMFLSKQRTPSESKYLPLMFPINLAFLVFSYSVASVTTFVISKAIYVDSRMFK